MCWTTARSPPRCAPADRRDGRIEPSHHDRSAGIRPRPRMTLSRRALIHRVGKAGGVAAAYRTMAAMGLLPIPEAYAGPPSLPPGNGRKIVIIGAGIAGMVLAWELRKSGYAPTMLEARSRPGGRNWSLRAGDEIRETDGVQRVRWDARRASVFQSGPGSAAIPPPGHPVLLPRTRRARSRSCATTIAVRCCTTRAHSTASRNATARWSTTSAATSPNWRQRRSTRKPLAQPVSTEDRERIRAFLRAFGALDRDMTYKGLRPCGLRRAAGRRNAGRQVERSRSSCSQILASGFWEFNTNFGESLASGGDDDAAGRRHGPHRPGVRPQARRRSSHTMLR